MVYSKSADMSVFYVGEKTEHLQRIPFHSDFYSEEWLINTLEENPEILKSSSIDTDFSDIVCIGKNIIISDCVVDCMFITSSGHIIALKTSLSGSESSRRSIIADLMDAGNELRKLDTETLDEICSEYTYAKYGKAYTIFDLMAEKGYLYSGDHPSFTDKTNYNLSSGRIVLIAAGNGIRSGTAKLAEYLKEYAKNRFSIGILDIGAYKLNNGYIVVPNYNMTSIVIERYQKTKLSV